MLATKLRALLQRDKGRDPFDLARGLQVFEDLDPDRLVAPFLRYLAFDGQRISQARIEQRLFAKLANPLLLLDLRPLLPAAEAETIAETATTDAIQRIIGDLVVRIPGETWAKTASMKERFGIDW